MKPAISMSLIITVAFSIAHSDLISDMGSMANGKEMRLAYVKGGSPVAFNTANNAAVYVVSSANGQIRKIYPSGTSVASVRCPNFTHDGTKVIVYNFGAGQVAVLDYSTGNSIRTINIGSGYEMYDYWYNASNGKDYIIVSNNSVIEAMDINAPTEKILITNKLSNIDVHDGGLQISDDGKKMALVKQTSNGESLGLLTGALAGSGDGTFVATNNGCWPQVRGGTPIMLSQNDGDHPGMPNHWGPQLFNENGSKAQFIATSDTLKKFIEKDAANRRVSNCSNGEVTYATDGHRWTRDRNYFSFYCNGSALNPILWRTTDNKWIFIETNKTCTFAGDMDMVLVTALSIKTSRSAASIAGKEFGAAESYSVFGKRIADSKKDYRGILIQRAVNGISVVRTIGK